MWALGTTAAVPLFFNFANYSPELAKVSLFIFLVSIGFAIYLFAEFPSLPSGALPRRLGLFLGVSALSTLFSIAPLQSLFGNYNSFQGLATLLGYGLFFWWSSHLFSDRDFPKIFRTLALSAGVIFIFGLLQYLVGGFRGRIFSTLETPVFLSTFCVLIFPVGLALFSAAGSRVARALWGAFIALTIFVSFCAAQRTGWMGLALVFAMFWPKLSPEDRARLLRPMVIVFLISLALCISFGMVIRHNAQRVPNAYQSLSEAFSFQDSIKAQRALLAKTAFFAALRRPILGWGPDTYDMLFFKNKPKGFARVMEDTVPSKSYCELLNVLCEMGFLGAFFYLAIWVSAFRGISQRMRTSAPWLPFWAASRALLAGYLFCSLFFYSAISLTLPVILIFALLCSPGRPQGAAPTETLAHRSPSLFIRACLSLILFVFAGGAARAYMADTHFSKGLSERSSRNFLQARFHLEKAVAFGGFLDPAYHQQLGILLSASGRPQEAVNYFKRAIQRKPLHPYLYIPLAQAHEALEDYTATRASYEKAFEIDSENPYLAYQFANFWLRQKNLTEAERWFLKSVELEDFFTSAHQSLGELYLQRKDLARARAHYERAVFLDPSIRVPKILQTGEK